MTRSGLSSDWLDSHALAAAYLDGYLRHADALTVLGRIEDAGRAHAGENPTVTGLVQSLRMVYLDVADALVELCAAPEPMADFQIGFENLDDGTPAEPGAFLDSADGRATVWGTRLASAAVRGDRAMSDALSCALELLEHGEAALHLSRLVTASGAVLKMRHFFDQGAAHVIEALDGERVIHRADCADCGAMLALELITESRDRAAALHTLEQGHTVKRWNE